MIQLSKVKVDEAVNLVLVKINVLAGVKLQLRYVVLVVKLMRLMVVPQHTKVLWD